ncbi:MAG: ABC transporter ATP-binding protein [Verrucomicrobia bacterium]|nr:ABC transporter ATP-binding protein [Verrucomicrobiota bacterium]
MTPAISIRHLSKVFPVPFRRERVVAVEDLSLEVAPGQVYGLLGPNGSGKSTTMKMVLGLVPPTRGQVEVFGVDADRVESRVAVGFLPENPYFQKFLTGTETVAFFGRLAGVPKRDLRDRARELLRLVGLEEAADRRLSGYSKGMLQRIGLAQALVQEPRLLVLDEPTAGVDPAGSRDIKDLILKFKDRGITVLLCSHLLAQVQEICDRIGILHRGRLVCEGPLAELIEKRAQTELVLENAPAGLLAEIEAAVGRHEGARLLHRRHPQASLEEFFLTVTGDEKKP